MLTNYLNSDVCIVAKTMQTFFSIPLMQKLIYIAYFCYK